MLVPVLTRTVPKRTEQATEREYRVPCRAVEFRSPLNSIREIVKCFWSNPIRLPW